MICLYDVTLRGTRSTVAGQHVALWGNVGPASPAVTPEVLGTLKYLTRGSVDLHTKLDDLTKPE
jgi:hypothetical protein